jgi:hypothetical protein
MIAARRAGPRQRLAAAGSSRHTLPRSGASSLIRRHASAQPCRVTPHPFQPCALDDLMRKLLVVHRLLEAEERLARRAAARPDETAVVGQAPYLVTGS